METTKDPLATLDEVISAGQAATPGEWRGEEYEESFPESDDADYPGLVSVQDEKGRWCYFIRIDERYNDRHENLAGRDATFIALAKNALPSLIALRERVKGLEAVVATMTEEVRSALMFLDSVTATDDDQSDGIGLAENALHRAIATLEGK